MADARKKLELELTGKISPGLETMLKRLEKLETFMAGTKNGGKQADIFKKIEQAAKAAANAETARAKKAEAQLRTQIALLKKKGAIADLTSKEKRAETAELKRQTAEIRKQNALESKKPGGGKGGGGKLGTILGSVSTAMLGAKTVSSIAGLAAKLGPIVLILGTIAKTASSIFNLFRRLFFLTNALLSLYGQLGGVVIKFWAMVGKQVGTAIAMVAKFGAELLKISGVMDQLELRLGAVFGGQAPMILGRIIELAQEMPHTIDDMIKGFIRAKAMGVWDLFGERGFFAASDLALVFDRSVEDAIMAIGQAGANRMDRLTRGFGVRATDLAPFGAHIGTQGALQGKTMSERQDNMLAAIRLIESRYGGATKAMSRSFEQLMSNMEDLWFDFGKKIRDSGVTHLWAEFLDTVQETYRVLANTGRLNKIIFLFKQISVVIQNVGVGLLSKIGPLIDKWAPRISQLVEKLGTALVDEQVWERIAGFMDAAFRASEGLIVNLSALVPKITSMIPDVLDLVATLTDMFIKLAPVAALVFQIRAGLGMTALTIAGKKEESAALAKAAFEVGKLADEMQKLTGPDGLGSTLHEVAEQLRKRNQLGTDPITRSSFPPAAAPSNSKGGQGPAAAGVGMGSRGGATFGGVVGGKGGMFNVGSEINSAFSSGSQMTHDAIVSGFNTALSPTGGATTPFRAEALAGRESRLSLKRQREIDPVGFFSKKGNTEKIVKFFEDNLITHAVTDPFTISPEERGRRHVNRRYEELQTARQERAAAKEAFPPGLHRFFSNDGGELLRTHEALQKAESNFESSRQLQRQLNPSIIDKQMEERRMVLQSELQASQVRQENEAFRFMGQPVGPSFTGQARKNIRDFNEDNPTYTININAPDTDNINGVSHAANRGGRVIVDEMERSLLHGTGY